MRGALLSVAAGRDGEPCSALLFCSSSDLVTLTNLQRDIPPAMCVVAEVGMRR
jgi:hypothetical protein